MPGNGGGVGGDATCINARCIPQGMYTVQQLCVNLVTHLGHECPQFLNVKDSAKFARPHLVFCLIILVLTQLRNI